MNKKFLTFGILTIVLAGVFVPTHVAHAGISSWFGLDTLVSDLFKAIALILMGLSSLVLMLCGWMFDWIVKFTIIDMAKNIGGPAGVGGSITLAWATLRDVANMCFIFVLLYAAFKTMFDSNFSNFGKTIRDIIIVALLINFSLFFSKVVIDASNIVSVGFYNSIASSTAKLDPTTGTPIVGGEFTGISAGYMSMLRLQTFFSAGFLDPKNKLEAGQILTMGIMSSVFMLITAVILLIAGVMFAARFIILIFLMILSPLALIAFIIPGQKKHFDDWLDALKNQSFFAPLYFALTWVVFKLGTSLLATLDETKTIGGVAQVQDWSKLTTEPTTIMALIINYVLIIGFSIAALIFAKQMASKGAAGTAFKSISGGIGTAAIGGSAWAARNSVGRVSSMLSETQREKWSKSSAGRAGLWLADKGKKASFDVRSSSTLGKVPGLGGELGIIGKAGGKGGFGAAIDAKVKAKAAYAKDVYGQTAREKEIEGESKGKTKAANEASKPEEDRIRRERGEEARKAHEELKKAERESKAPKISPETQRKVDEAERESKATKVSLETQKKMEEAEEEFKTKSTSTLEYAGKKEDIEASRVKAEEARKVHEAAINVQNTAAATKFEEARKVHQASLDAQTIAAETKFEEAQRTHAATINKQRAGIEETDYSETVRGLREEAKRAKEAWDPIKENAKNRRKEYANRLGGGLTGWMAGNKAASRKVREEATGPSNEKKFADAYKSIIDAETPVGTTSGGGTSPAPAPTPTAPAPAAPAPAPTPTSPTGP